MKVLVFAHVPPPHHGQSYMVQLMLAGFGGDQRKKTFVPSQSPYHIDCYHVNARLSKKQEDIGKIQFGKLLLLLGYCLQAIWCRFRYGVEIFFYIPAPGKRSALYRDWIVMFVCRRFFKRLILQWQAAGLARWLETPVPTRWRAITCRALKNADLSIVLSQYNRFDAEKFSAKQIEIIGNGIPDPCPDFEKKVLPRRLARLAARRRLLQGEVLEQVRSEQTGSDPQLFRILLLGHCMRQKGLFDALHGLIIANARLSREGVSIRAHLTIAGEFVDPEERSEFEGITRGNPFFVYAGFVTGESKKRLLTDSDCLCFPTFHYAESFGLVVAEAMAFGLSIVATRWRSLPELFPPGFSGLVDIHSPEQIAEALIRSLTTDTSHALRDVFLQRFTIERHLSELAKAFHSVEKPDGPVQ